MTESLHEYVVRNLEAARGEWRAIAQATGVPHSTISRIARRSTPDPGVSNVEKLAKYFRARDAQSPAAAGEQIPYPAYLS